MITAPAAISAIPSPTGHRRPLKRNTTPNSATPEPREFCRSAPPASPGRASSRAKVTEPRRAGARTDSTRNIQVLVENPACMAGCRWQTDQSEVISTRYVTDQVARTELISTPSVKDRGERRGRRRRARPREARRERARFIQMALRSHSGARSEPGHSEIPGLVLRTIRNDAASFRIDTQQTGAATTSTPSSIASEIPRRVIAIDRAMSIRRNAACALRCGGSARRHVGVLTYDRESLIWRAAPQAPAAIAAGVEPVPLCAAVGASQTRHAGLASLLRTIAGLRPVSTDRAASGAVHQFCRFSGFPYAAEIWKTSFEDMSLMPA